jgi:putative ABC transport system permease protein
LLLSPAAARPGGFGIRPGGGGGRGRLVRQLFTESAVVAGTGGILGLLFGTWLVHLVRIAAPAALPRLPDVAIGGPVLAVWIGATAFAVVMTALGPAIRATRVDPSEALRGADRAAGSGFRGAQARRLRDGLLVVEAALAIVLIVGASLLIRSFRELMSVDAGYSPGQVLIAAVELPRGSEDARTGPFIDAALARVRRLPGVAAAGAGAMIPLMKQTAVMPFTVPEVHAGGKATRGRARVYWVTPGYAEALGLRLEAGRFFTGADVHPGTVATLVNEEFVRQHLAAPQVTGLTLPGLMDGDRSVSAEIVGVVGNVLKDGNDQSPQPEVYFVHGAHGQRIVGRVNVVIRTLGDPAALVGDVRAMVRAIDPDAVIDRVEPLSTSVAASMDGPRFAAAVMGGFAAVAMLLAGIGLYGALSYSVSQRDRELGVRAALGAQRRDLVGLVVGEGLMVVLPGIALGMLGAIGFGRLMRELLFGITPLDAVTFAAAPVILALTAVAACLAPALRAAAADPAVTLRK